MSRQRADWATAIKDRDARTCAVTNVEFFDYSGINACHIVPLECSTTVRLKVLRVCLMVLKGVVLDRSTAVRLAPRSVSNARAGKLSGKWHHNQCL